MQTTWLERGTVRGRVALLLRSAEIQPLFEDFPIEFSQNSITPPSTHFPPLTRTCSRAGLEFEVARGAAVGARGAAVGARVPRWVRVPRWRRHPQPRALGFLSLVLQGGWD